MFLKNNLEILLVVVLMMLGLSVVLGAFGSHGLKGLLTPYMLEVYHTACQYLSVHSLGLFLIIILNITTKFKISKASIYSLLFGVLIFSSTLIFIAVSELLNMPGLKKLGMITPIGGVLMVLGYFLASLNVLKTLKSQAWNNN